jgi:mannose/cellobiose epimerase-like protein (N-acyl-D-glucosamine 2-epimerase family)
MLCDKSSGRSETSNPVVRHHDADPDESFPAEAVEFLEARQLLSVDPSPWTVVAPMSDGEASPTASLVDSSVATVSATPVHAPLVTDDHVDAVAVRDGLIRFVDTWNGGQSGRLGTSGMGVYVSTWDGLFRMNLNRQFQPVVNTYTNDMTIIAQSRAIYINVEAYRNAPANDRARFLSAVQRGADYLLGKAVDPTLYTGNPGGMWWGLQPDGVSPPVHTTPIGGTVPRYKDAYGQVQSLFALAQAYSITGDADHLNGAFKQLDVWNGQFADTANGPGAFLPTANENYTQRVGNRNLDYMTHAFEALLALNDATPAADPRKAGLATQITDIGNFITTRMYRDAAGSTTTGYIPWWYDANWNPSSDPTQQFSTPGHNFEMAYLLSRAVERGFNASWLNVADKLVAYTLKYSFNNDPASSQYGAVPHEKLAFNGARFNTSPDNLIWWQSSEAARTLLHFAVVRGRSDLWDEYDAASAFIKNHFIDPLYGGWFTYLSPTTLLPNTTDKGTVWTGGYHEAMLDAERIRLSTGDVVATLPAAADAYVRDGTYAGQNFGGTTDLVVKKSATAGNTRESYLRFSFIGLGEVGDAKLRVFGRSTTTQNVPVALYTVSSTTWSEAGTTWNNKPASAANALATKSITGTGGQWYEFDVTTYLQQQKAAGATAVTFVLKATGTTDAQALFNSDENVANQPQLVVQPPAQQVQALVVSSSNVTVPEGGSAQFTVKLATQPASDVNVTVARQSGDTDLTGGASLIFTSANWNTPQAVTINAAADADTTNGSAVFAVTSAGLPTKTVTATEADDDTSETIVTKTASADAYVRDGSYAGANYGTTVDLQVKKDAVGWNRESYVTFPLSGVTSATSVKLRLFGALQSTIGTVIPVSVYGATSATWVETGLTWNTRPSTGATALATQNLADSTGRWYEWDVTSFVQDQIAQGKTAVSFALKSAQSGTAAVFSSDESSTNKPQLVLTTSTVVQQGLVVSTSTASVPEGATAQFTVKLAAQPTADVTVIVARNSGDSDITVASGASLVFTSANWNSPQAVTLAAAQDADSTNGSASILVSSSGLTSKTVTATEVDDDVVAPVTLRATADAYVRDGTYATTNFGGDATISVKKNASVGYSRESYLRFSLSGITGVGSAKLRLYGNISETVAGGVAMQVYGVDNTSWVETGINWNNKPAPTTGVLVTKTIAGTTAAWYEIDLTTYVQQRKAAGATAVTLLLRNAIAGNAQCMFASDEAAANRPELVITPAAAAPVGVITSTPSLAVREGSTAQFDVRLAAQPASNVVVLIARQAGGDPDVTAAKSTLTFTPANWSVAQSVNVAAANDADALSGSAFFVVSSPGAEPVTIVASEIESNAAVSTTSLRATDDTYVRDGAYATANFGGATDLVVKRSGNAGNTREGYLSFEMSGVPTIASGKLRLFGRLSATTNPTLVTTVYPASGVTWAEGTINWNNRPAAGATSLGSVTVSGTTGKWYELDVTNYLKAEKAAGRNRVTFVLRNSAISDAQSLFTSDEATGNRPELLIAQPAAVPQDLDTRLMRAVDLADGQLRLTLSDLGTDATKYVQVTGSDGKWNVVDASTWTSAMLPGSLWYMARETGDAYWITEAVRRTLPLQGQKTQPDDLAFRLAYAYWPLYGSTGNAMYRQVLIDAAASKVAQYNGIVGAFRSPFRASTSGDPRADFGVLMDQITDVELVLWAAKETGNTAWTDMAVRHLQTLAQYVVRPDGSTYQWTYFNSQSGEFIGGEAYQGYSADSTWSRGQAWAIYGFTAAYRLTGREEFLTAAKKVTDWYLAHLPPGDMVPYWDFNCPDIPNTYKDSSAAAVAAAGMAQLADVTPDAADATKYRQAAGDTLFQLASPAYLSDGVASRGVLLHGAWFVPNGKSDSSTIWGDYFFLEAINRYMAGKSAV